MRITKNVYRLTYLS